MSQTYEQAQRNSDALESYVGLQVGQEQSQISWFFRHGFQSFIFMTWEVI